LKDEIDDIYTKHPYFGSRRMSVMLSLGGSRIVNRKRVQRLMREMGIAAIYPRPNTSRVSNTHKVYPYLLRSYKTSYPNEVWSSDITYVKVSKGFCYLTAVIDWHSRYVLSWSLSNSMDVSFCVDSLQAALCSGTPKIFNTDQGSQYTSRIYTDELSKRDISISMDGRGRALDNIFVERLWRSVKYENIYPNGYNSLVDVRNGLESYFKFYNYERPHQSLNYKTPFEVHHGEEV